MRTALRPLPKVLLHDHLDGGLRPETVLDLAERSGYAHLPASDVESLSRWFFQGDSGSLETYLGAFDHTVGVMQTTDALERVTYEAVADLAADGVIYAELRFAPIQHTREGLEPAEVVSAVLAGFEAGREDTGMHGGLILDAMRQDDDSLLVARLALDLADRGVIGFDLAGPEVGFPPTRHLQACHMVSAGGIHLTIHAGEGDGVQSVAAALEPCGAERIGHGVRIVEDTEIEHEAIVGMGPVATELYQRRVPLEVCPTSNVHTRVSDSIEDHPVGMLHRAGFAVTLNTDNRLMSSTSMTNEFALAAEHHRFEMEDFRVVTLTAVDAAFCGSDLQSDLRRLVNEGYDRAS
jgi:adenosine deaminase